MKPSPAIICGSFLLLFLLLPSLDAGDRRLTYDEARGREGVSFRPAPLDFRWAADGVHLATGRGRDVAWFDAVTGADAPVEGEPAAWGRAQDLREIFERVPGFDADAARRAARGRALRARDGEAVVVEFERDLFHLTQDGLARRLTNDTVREEGTQLSPDGRTICTVKDHDLYFIPTSGEPARRVTKDGSDKILNGRLDWVYQEEIYGRGNFTGFWWSPDSRQVAFLRLDERKVPEFTILDHTEVHPDREVTSYPKAGDPNPTVRVGLARVRGGVTWVDLDRYQGQEILVVRVQWRPDGERLLVQVQDRIQTWLDLLSVDPQTGRAERIVREESSSWVNVLGQPRWLRDGSFLWLSERTGYRHIHHYAPDGELLGTLTRGEWPVGSILAVDEEARRLWFSTNRDEAVGQQVYTVGFDGQGLRRLTTGPGHHSARFNRDRSLFIDRYTSVEKPLEFRLCRAADGETVRVLGSAEVPALEEYAYSRPELFQVRARDGFLLDALLIRPPGHDSSRRHPVWLQTYSGPNAPTVRNRWQSSAWDQFLAQQGLLVFKVNNRSSSGRGQVTTAACYRDLGRSELSDLEDALRWLIDNEGADRGRIGITGWSYGGFMAGYALTHSDLFRLGVAGAGVYDWGLYDSIYTERYMSTPQDNPGGYASSSVIGAASNLQGHLVLAHGTLDDNVHVQNTLQLARELQKAGKSFEMMLYPSYRHGLGRDAREHWNRLAWGAIQGHLLDPVLPVVGRTYRVF